MDFLYDFGLDSTDVEILKAGTTDEIYSELTFFKNLVKENINYLKDFGVANYTQVIVKYPEIFIRDTESFKNVLAKFDKQDLIDKVAKNAAVIKKMVDYVDNN